jgi:tRNA modification GTPase
LISTADRGRIYREGVRIAIVGRPNVGKSSLLNALLRENRAIVTPIPGTTRDVIEESANIRGIPITAIDTAGLRETKDVVERIGVERAHAAAESASLILFVIDASRDWTEEDDLVFKVISGKRSIWVANKSDMVDEQAAILVQRDLFKRSNRRDVVALSALTLEGMDDLEWLIAEELLHGHTVEETSAVVSNVRHLRALESARDSLKEAEITVENQLAPDFISIDLRAALDALGQITGETATEDIIHRIFQDFCIGK